MDENKELVEPPEIFHSFIETFHTNGKKIYLVGGAIRNLLLNKPVRDYDFATDATPTEIESYFERVIMTGVQHGTVTVVLPTSSYEVTTFRMDGKYTDSRRPDSVEFVGNIETDLKRRDFTINSMACENADITCIIDPENGQEDLARKLLKAVGDPIARFEEDPLRILRLFRFASELDFEIDPGTYQSAITCISNGLLHKVAKERIYKQLTRAMNGIAVHKPFSEIKLLSEIFAPLFIRNLTENEFKVLQSLPTAERWPFWLTLACSEGSRPLIRETLERGKFQKNMIREIMICINALESVKTEINPNPKKIINDWGYCSETPRKITKQVIKYLRNLVQVGYLRNKNVKLIERIEEILKDKDPIFLRELSINGSDLCQKGVNPSVIREQLECLQKWVWFYPWLNTQENLWNKYKELFD